MYFVRGCVCSFNIYSRFPCILIILLYKSVYSCRHTIIIAMHMYNDYACELYYTSTKCIRMAEWRHWLTYVVHKQGEHIPQHCYISHNHILWLLVGFENCHGIMACSQQFDHSVVLCVYGGVFKQYALGNDLLLWITTCMQTRTRLGCCHL